MTCIAFLVDTQNKDDGWQNMWGHWLRTGSTLAASQLDYVAQKVVPRSGVLLSHSMARHVLWIMSKCPKEL